MAQYTLDELEKHYTDLTARITALDLDIGRELDSERRKILIERRAEKAVEREKIGADLAIINPRYPLTTVADAAQIESRVTTLERDVKRIWHLLNPSPRRLVARLMCYALIGILVVIWLKPEPYSWLIANQVQAFFLSGALVGAAMIVWWLAEDGHDERG